MFPFWAASPEREAGVARAHSRVKGGVAAALWQPVQAEERESREAVAAERREEERVGRSGTWARRQARAAVEQSGAAARPIASEAAARDCARWAGRSLAG